MKALEILKEGLVFMNQAIKVNPNSVKELQSEIDRYVEAIDELEEINSISCEGCIYNTYAFENEQCIYCSRRCVDFYEAKGE